MTRTHMASLRRVAIQDPRPICLAGTGECQLRTITASQLSLALLLSTYVGTQVYFLGRETEASIVLIQMMLMTLGTLLYVYLSFALVEYQLITLLRALKPTFAWIEFGYRVALPIIIALLPLSLTTWVPAALGSWLAPIRAPGELFGTAAVHLAGYHALIYLSFLLWDGIVYFGAPADPSTRSEIRSIARGFAITDGVGLCILLLFQALRPWNDGASVLILVAFIFFTAWQVSTVGRAVRVAYAERGGFGRGILR